MGVQIEDGFVPCLKGHRDVWPYRNWQSDFTIIFVVFEIPTGVECFYHLRPVPGHAGRVIRDTTSAPDQAACTVSGANFLQPPPVFRSGVGSDCSA